MDWETLQYVKALAKKYLKKGYKFSLKPKDQSEARNKLDSAGIHYHAGAHEGGRMGIIAWIDAEADERTIKQILQGIQIRRMS